jgi:phospholipid/cholesterol/gamma-HCH transport system substrate-binding protein
MEANRERTLVGLFVLIAGGLLFGAVLVVSGGTGRNTVSHFAYFKFAGGLQPGAPVRFGGMAVGKVDRVRVDPGNSTRIEIRILIARDAPVKIDSQAKISTLGALSDNYIEISTGSERTALAPPDSALQSAEAFGLPQLADAAQAMLPDLQQALRKLNQNLDDLQVTLGRANDLLNDRNRTSVGNSLNNLDHLVADARPRVTDSLDNLNGLLSDTRPKVAATLANAQELTVKLGPLVDDFKATTARANDTLSHLDSTLTENRSDIRASVTELRDTLEKSTTLLGQLNRTLDQNSPNIDDLLDNLRLTTENLRALTETLARSPASLIRGIKLPDRKPGDAPK